jgi:hypothetical protein
MGKGNSRTQFHPLMRYMDTYLRAARYKTDEGYLKPNKKHMVDVFVTEACVDKAVTFTNRLLLSLVNSGYQVGLISYTDAGFSPPDYDIFEDEKILRKHRDIWSPWKLTHFEIGGVGFGLMIFEMMSNETAMYIDGTYYRDCDMTPALLKKAKHHYTWTSERNFPTGRLCLLVHSYDGWVRKWKEVRKGEDLAKQIPQIIRLLKDSAPELLVAKERMRIAAENSKREREEYWRKYELEKEQRILVSATKKSKQMIEGIIDTWNESTKLHNFFASLEREISNSPEDEKRELLTRISLVKKLIGTANPLDHLAKWKSPDELANVLRSNGCERFKDD